MFKGLKWLYFFKFSWLVFHSLLPLYFILLFPISDLIASIWIMKVIFLPSIILMNSFIFLTIRRHIISLNSRRVTKSGVKQSSGVRYDAWRRPGSAMHTHHAMPVHSDPMQDAAAICQQWCRETHWPHLALPGRSVMKPRWWMRKEQIQHVRSDAGWPFLRDAHYELATS